MEHIVTAEIDCNSIETNLQVRNIQLYDVRKAPFDLYGFYQPQTEAVFKRLPDEIAEKINEGVRNHAKDTAGGRVRFTTNSEYIVIKCLMPCITHFPHMPLTGTSGFDLYLDTAHSSKYYATFEPSHNMETGYEQVVHFNSHETRPVTINFPLYNHVNDLYIGIESDANLACGLSYSHDKPVVYYGSSITQGGCASRPGNAYATIISRSLDIDHINLGFSGSARAEDEIADYIAGLKMSAFVLDYDHNAPSIEYLEQSHEKFFRRFRARNPDIPVVIVTKPDFDRDPAISALRREAIYRTYQHASLEGDRNIAFVDGEKLFEGSYRDACTVDSCHPNDAGFIRMAEVIGNSLKQML